ncbi:hypothetical protein ZOSMA_85G00730 [Zostera marina]|uniref:Uncharacterized protein n=1 Tax=Zostera marina TaxID=29655 RepID=A0A0K9NL60_ZOSMR|nr:hypothetical protein ZOSMA_85G00730 [Zostera marina]
MIKYWCDSGPNLVGVWGWVGTGGFTIISLQLAKMSPTSRKKDPHAHSNQYTICLENTFDF